MTVNKANDSQLKRNQGKKMAGIAASRLCDIE